MRDRKGKAAQHKTPIESAKNGPSTSYGVPVKYVAAVLGLLGACLAVFFKFQYNTSAMLTFAPANQLSTQLTHMVTCSDDYKLEQFDECIPKRCGRVVMDNLVTEEEASYLLGVAKKGISYGGSSGGASILDLHSGALSKNDKFINIYSILPEDEQFTEQDFAMYTRAKNKIHQSIAQYFDIPPSSLYLTKPTFFSRMNTTEAKTVHDEYWHEHVDKTTYGSFHYTSLLYLTTYNIDFTGGRFVFVDGETKTAVEPRLGRVSFFTSGSENVHYVEKLESGVRYAITISFSCDPQMAIPDPDVR